MEVPGVLLHPSTGARPLLLLVRSLNRLGFLSVTWEAGDNLCQAQGKEEPWGETNCKGSFCFSLPPIPSPGIAEWERGRGVLKQIRKILNHVLKLSLFPRIKMYIHMVADRPSTPSLGLEEFKLLCNPHHAKHFNVSCFPKEKYYLWLDISKWDIHWKNFFSFLRARKRERDRMGREVQKERERERKS